MDEIFAAIDKRPPIADHFKKYESPHEFHYDYYKINVRNFMIFYVVIDDDPTKKSWKSEEYYTIEETYQK